MPTDYKTLKHKGLAFIRYLRKRDAENAIKLYNNTNLGKGRNILVYPAYQKTYFSQDETPAKVKNP